MAHQLNFDISVAVPSDNRESMESFVNKGIKVFWIPLQRTGINLLRDLKLLRELVNIIRKTNPDIIFLTTIKPVIYGSLAARLSDSSATVVTLMTGLGYIYQSPKSIRDFFVQSIAKALQRMAFARNDFILFQNTTDQREFINRRLGNRKSKFILVGSGVDLTHFQPKSSATPERFTVLMASRLLVDKGVIEYLEACKNLKAINSNFRFLLAGPFDSNPRALKFQDIKKYIDHEIVEYLGELRDIRDGISQAHVVVLPSYREGMPRILLEALAMDKAIITSDGPGCREFSKYEIPSIEIIATRNIEQLQNAILKMEKKLRAGLLSDLSRKTAENFFNAETVNKNILSIVSERKPCELH